MDSAAARTDRPRRDRPEIFGRSAVARLARQRPHPARRRSRSGQNAHRQNDGGLHPDRLPAFAIYARFVAGGFDRHPYLQSAHRRIHDQARPALFQFDSRRRNQSRAGQGPERAPRGDAGTPGHDWRNNLSPLRSVPRSRHPKSARTGRHLSTAGSAARSLHVEIAHRLSAKIRGAADPRFDGDLRRRT